ncbi:Disease resistance protein [Corchorus olitorius]|uniref:Disease resistance protein n=1 Tax=Corchorus olitorius TaxID=93759 RepID=A0A1R3IXQ9_9ROSI|nr:Disease resistance protein [Corchorus olitorius]
MFVVGEAALAALFEVLFNKLTSLDVKFASDKQVGKEIENWERKLKKIYDVLADAEERQMKDAHVNLWLVDLQDLAYDVDDILDEFAYAALGLKMKTFQAQPSSSKAQNPLLNFGISLRPSTFRFNNKMMSKIKEVSERLDALVALKTQLQLRDKYVNRVIPKRTPTSSLVNEADVFGRKQDKEKIIDLLLSNDGTDVGVSVIPIVGMGGVGKTTLAQLVYNESKHHFDIHAWACVSEEFDIINVTRTILQAVTGQSCDSNDFNSLQVRLHETLSGKKFLIVLDDVWNKSYDDWTKLRSPFVAGAPGSKIIVTTRDSGVSSIMRTVSDFLVQKLPEDDSLSMLAYHALGAKDFCSHLDLKEIGMEIVKKCDGLPLATKTIGGLLRSRLGREVWKDILESEIWNLPEENNAEVSVFHHAMDVSKSSIKKEDISQDVQFQTISFAACFLVPSKHHSMNKNLHSKAFSMGMLILTYRKSTNFKRWEVVWIQVCPVQKFKELMAAELHKVRRPEVIGWRNGIKKDENEIVFS